jgi:hypothetical protein
MLARSRRGFGAGAKLLSQLSTMRKRLLYRSRCVRRGGFNRRKKAKNAEDSQRSRPCTSSTLTSNISKTAPTSALPVSVIARSRPACVRLRARSPARREGMRCTCEYSARSRRWREWLVAHDAAGSEATSRAGRVGHLLTRALVCGGNTQCFGTKPYMALCVELKLFEPIYTACCKLLVFYFRATWQHLKDSLSLARQMGCIVGEGGVRSKVG